ncbi:MAG: cell division topological specificity factor MinE [Bdellovibrionota bacterium]
MFNVLKNLFSKEPSSKVHAKNRLQFVLVQDRAGLNNDELASFRKELLNVIEKYFVVKEGDFGIDYTRDGNTTKLTINSPVVAKRDFEKLKNNDNNSKNDSQEKLEIRSKSDNNQKKKKAAN